MELVFQENRRDYLRRIMDETAAQEQTVDLVVPDSIADCDRVVDAFGTVLIRSEECSSGSASVAGVVQAGVLFVSEDGVTQCMTAQIPFSFRKDFGAEQAECTMQCRCQLKSMDARMLNSRKILLRAGIVCTMTVYAREPLVTYEPEEPAPNLQLKQTTLPLRMPVGLGEKSFALNEELETGAPMSRLLKWMSRIRIGEQRLVGNKAVFKGEFLVHALYSDPDEALHTHDWTVPFSQYAEMEREYDEDSDVLTALSPTSVELEPDFGNGRLYLSANLLAQCTAVGPQTVRVIEDAFCTDAELKPQWCDWALSGLLDSQSFRETAVAAGDQAAKSVVDVWVYPDEVSKMRTDGRIRLELPLNCSVLYTDGDGALQGRMLRTSVTMETELAEESRCAVTGIDCGEAFSAAGENGIELRLPVSVTVESSAEHRLRGLSGGEIEPLPASAEPRPAVILRRTDGEEEIWEIAKSLRTPMAAIREANDLEGPTAPANTMLLIPMG